MERLGHPTGRASSPPSVPEFSSPVGRASCRAEAVGRLSIRLATHAPTRGCGAAHNSRNRGPYWEWNGVGGDQAATHS